MHYVLAIQITVQKFGNNRLVKYVHGFVSELIGREIQVVIFTNLRLLWSQKLKNWEVVSPLGFN